LDVVTKPHSSDRPARRQTSQSGCTVSSQFLTDPRGSTVEHRSTGHRRSLYHTRGPTVGSHCFTEISSPTAWFQCAAQIGRTTWINHATQIGRTTWINYATQIGRTTWIK
jgi:hypothetical protein